MTRTRQTTAEPPAAAAETEQPPVEAEVADDLSAEAVLTVAVATDERPAEDVLADAEETDEPSATEAADAPGDDVGEAEVVEEADEEVVQEGASRGHRRARVLLLALLAALATLLTAFAGWYLILRKPISEFPLPLPVTAQMPGYGYSFYGALRPTGIAVKPDGSRIYATQTAGDTAVIAFDAQGNRVATFTPPETGTDHVFVYLAVNPANGDVYVTDRPAGTVYVYGEDGSYKGPLAVPASLTGWQPLGISFDLQGNLFVTDASINAVQEFTPDGNLVRTIGEAGEFSFPNSVVEDSTGRLYIADSNNGRVVVLDKDGNQIGIVRRGPSDGDVALPRGLAIDDRQRVYVVDSVDQSVKVYQAAADATSAPAFIGRFGDLGTGDGAFRYPNAVATDARGRIYVADWDNDRVQVWTY